EFNRLASADAVAIGQNIFIPDGQKIQPAPAPTPWQSVKRIFTPDTTPSVSVGTYIWPTSCRTITQYFGWRHTGVDVACGFGQPVYAARDGVIVKAAYGWNGGYGNVVIIDHGDGIHTLYAHNTEFYSKVGDFVAQGTVIAGMGSTGRSTGPHTHFEVHVNGSRVNPLSYIR
ncbi:MAG TPA: M23 family metallopeptidase, partial [Patescibacteria group bacterium]|nr:M23 family metallopeptidase [Patescibacteria group bacterium]